MATSARFIALASPMSGADFESLVPGLKSHLIEGTMIGSITLDSREIVPGSLFVALKGEQVDGHSFVKNMVKSDLFGVLVDSAFAKANEGLIEELVKNKKSVFISENALKALQIAAKNQLTRIDYKKVIGITGSSGKTTVKEMISSTLATRYRVWASPGNMNSVIGIPLAIFGIPFDAEVLVMELAMSEANEMFVLSDIARPDIAVITNIGLAHIANLGSQDAIAHEKKMIAAHFDGSQTLYVPKDDAYRDFLSKDIRGKVIHFGFDEGQSSYKTNSYHGQIVSIDGHEFTLGYMGQHIRLDALCAHSIARSLGLSNDEIDKGFKALSLPALRGELRDGMIKLVLDCYNANPSSMKASILSHNERHYEGRKVYIIGDMLELGEVSTKSHEAIGELLVQIGAQLVIFYGKEMKHGFEITQKVSTKQNFYYAESFENLEVLAKKLLKYGDLVLLKASRGMRLERILETVEKIEKGEVLHV